MTCVLRLSLEDAVGVDVSEGVITWEMCCVKLWSRERECVSACYDSFTLLMITQGALRCISLTVLKPQKESHRSAC